MATKGAPPLIVEAGRAGAGAARLGGWARLRRYGLSRGQLAWLLFLPSVLVLIGVPGYPAARTVWISLHTDRLDMPWLGQPFIGLRNYGFELQQQDFWNSLSVSVYFTAGSVISELLLGLAVALVVNESFRGRGLVRAAMLVPWAIPAVISGRLFGWMYSPGVGAFNALLNVLHLIKGPIDLLGSDTWAMPAVIMADVWKNTPFIALLLLAGLQVISAELYEAARVDGASVWQRFTRITLPLLRGSIVIALLFRTITAQQQKVPNSLRGTPSAAILPPGRYLSQRRESKHVGACAGIGRRWGLPPVELHVPQLPCRARWLTALPGAHAVVHGP